MSIKLFGENAVADIPVVRLSENPATSRVPEGTLDFAHPGLQGIAEVGLSAVKHGLDLLADTNDRSEYADTLLEDGTPLFRDEDELLLTHATMYGVEAGSFPYTEYTTQVIAGANLFRAAVVASRLFENGTVENDDYTGQLGDRIVSQRAYLPLRPVASIPYPPNLVAVGINGHETSPRSTKLQFMQRIPFGRYNHSRSVTINTFDRAGVAESQLITTRHDGVFSQLDSSGEFYSDIGNYVALIGRALSERRETYR